MPTLAWFLVLSGSLLPTHLKLQLAGPAWQAGAESL